MTMENQGGFGVSSVCPSCGRQVRPESAYCPGCGTSLGSAHPVQGPSAPVSPTPPASFSSPPIQPHSYGAATTPQTYPAPAYQTPYQPPYQAYYQPVPTGQRTNGMAIASLVLGIVWVWWLGSILAVIFGYVALGQIKQRNEGGRGMAIAGIILGFVGVATGIAAIVLVAVVAHTNPTYGLIAIP